MKYFQNDYAGCDDYGISTDLKILSTNDAPSSIVSLDQAKLYLSVVNTQEDVMITSMITNAIAQAEAYLNKDILSKTREFFLTEVAEPINLYFTPISSVDSVEIDGVAAVEGNEYKLLGIDDPRISFETLARNVKITYTTAGIGDETVRQGILSLVQHLYDRGASGTMVLGTQWQSFLTPFKTHGYNGTR